MRIKKNRTFYLNFILSSHLLLLTLLLVNSSIFGQKTKIKLKDIEPEKEKVTKKEKSVDKMTVEKLQELLKVESKIIEGQLGNWQVNYKGLPMIVVTDVSANRMRIISPIIEEKKLTAEDLRKLMQANFSAALDAKYAIYQEVLWSSFAHPLGDLTEVELKDALTQVFNLVRNYGTTYSSTGVVFGTTPAPEKEVFN